MMNYMIFNQIFRKYVRNSTSKKR